MKKIEKPLNPSSLSGESDKSAEWTSGPWKAVDQGEGERGKSLGIRISDARGLPMFFLPRGTPEHIANARLIAAAPDLYEALEWLTCFLEEGATPRLEHIEQSRAALAKARGELPVQSRDGLKEDAKE